MGKWMRLNLKSLTSGLPLESDLQVDEVEDDGQRVDGEMPDNKVRAGARSATQGAAQRPAPMMEWWRLSPMTA